MEILFTYPYALITEPLTFLGAFISNPIGGILLFALMMYLGTLLMDFMGQGTNVG